MKNEEDQKKLFLLCREGINSDAMSDYHQQVQVLNKYTVAQIVSSEQVVSSIRKELKKLFPEVKVDNQQISDILNNEVLKREVIEGEKVKEAQTQIKKILAKVIKQAEKKASTEVVPVEAESPPANSENS